MFLTNINHCFALIYKIMNLFFFSGGLVKEGEPIWICSCDAESNRMKARYQFQNAVIISIVFGVIIWVPLILTIPAMILAIMVQKFT